MTEIIFDEDIDWDKRVLCSDESCIGTIGPDGKCRECGKAYEGVLPEVLAKKNDTQVPDENHAAIVKPPDAENPDDDWDKRVLCSDGACIGVIGPDGKCKECGKLLSM